MLEKFTELVKTNGWNFYKAAMWRDGKTEIQSYTPHSSCANIYSVSKSFTSVAIGLLWDEKRLSLDDPIVKYLGDHLPKQFDERLPSVRIRDLLTQSSGIDHGTLFESDRYSVEDNDWIRDSLSRRLPFVSGEHYCYDNANYYMLACIAEIISAKPLTELLRGKLFEPLGIREYAWERCPMGHCMGATGLYTNIEALLSFGRLILDRGVYNGERLLSEEYISLAIDPKFAEGDNYGFSFRRRGGDIYCIGAADQIVYISPCRNAVFAAQGYNSINDFVKLVDDSMK